ncbi:hemerythrin domain-containing protein [Modestobacter sp. I12A-02628]|uniref:Hemerythrin domain-containing protein n=1 Tax=Goekera deserti TaxID=2497753 RepID=A0A7K3WGB8_9ACTN|nr:hemerythrin domain-containing protein [Goekera deserti]MPQ96507.1 hemerythrin domain-containing protein [Goekera deserti]NDI47178.1 hemerythrin domain-containing protein [Goekera deserti]NEL55422.1 hemerythrin domain-containing protein [Goekera deserti]
MPVPVRVTPRRPGDPLPDVHGLRVTTRVVRHDADRLAGLAERVAAGVTPVDGRRADAIARYVCDWADAVHHLHTTEDDVLWPVLVASAGPDVALPDRPRALAPALTRLRAAADSFTARPGQETATALAGTLAEVRDLLAERAADADDTVLPLVERWVSVADFARVDKPLRRRARTALELFRAAGTDQWSAVVARAGLLPFVGLALRGPALHRRERMVFGSAVPVPVPPVARR